MMKYFRFIIVIIGLITLVPSAECQNRALKVILSITDDHYEQHHYTFKVYKQNEKKPIQEVYLLDPDSTFIIKDLDKSMYFIQYISIFGTYIYRDLNLLDNNYLELQIKIPQDVCCYAIPDNQCPHGHFSKVVRVIYGYPTRFSMFRARYKRIHLGGCVVSDCDPNFYCKKHDIYF